METRQENTYQVQSKYMETDWLSSLLQSVFMGPCSEHQEHMKELFCIDCRLEFCKRCEAHSQHRRLEIYRSSSYDVVRLEEIQNHFDCSEVQTYMANGAEFVCLKTVHAAGEACGRTLRELSNRFCSIECKLSLLHVEKAVSSSRLGTENHQDDKSNEVESPLRERADLSGNQTSEESTTRSTLSSANVSEEATTSERTSFRSEERKGIPRRAPFS